MQCALSKRSYLLSTSPPLAAFRSRRLSRMMSNKGLNSNEALEESTATNSSVTWSGIRRVKALVALDIKDYSTEGRIRQRSEAAASARRWRAKEVERGRGRWRLTTTTCESCDVARAEL